MDININFKPLNEDDFALLKKWLNAPHVKERWQHDGNVEEKYRTYVQGYKLENGVKKPISAFIIYIDDEPVGYIQLYNAYDFAMQLTDLPESLGMIDFYVGDEKYLGQGIGSKILKVFNYQDFDYILVDPDINNIAAIETYKKSGFSKIKEHANEIWMIRENNSLNIFNRKI
jgi:RimJ/RimL family protein N-acetyltransferase